MESGETQIGKDILDFSTFVEAHSSVNPVGNTFVHEGFFEYP